MTTEQFYEESGWRELDYFDKKAHLFSYHDLIGFADAYYERRMLNAQQAKQILIEHQHWRRCNDRECECKMHSPKEIGEAIDVAIEMLESKI